jgi:hypothetical protein
MSCLFILRSFQYYGTNLRRKLVAPNYPRKNERFYNNKFRDLLIMQFNKVLITLSPWKRVALRWGAQCQAEPTNTQRYTEHSEKVTNSKQTWTVQSFGQYLNNFVLLITVYYFNMNAAETNVKGLSDNRFTSIIFLLRLAGIPVKMKKISTIYAAYMIIMIICSSSTFIGMYADVNVHWDNLSRAMTSMRGLFPFTNIMWIFSYCR